MVFLCVKGLNKNSDDVNYLGMYENCEKHSSFTSRKLSIKLVYKIVEVALKSPCLVLKG